MPKPRKNIYVCNCDGTFLIHVSKPVALKWINAKRAIWIGAKTCKVSGKTMPDMEDHAQLPDLGIHTSQQLFVRSYSAASIGLLIQHDRRIRREKREQRIAEADGFHTEAQWRARIEFFGWRCRYCGVELGIRSVTKDHQIAIANNGSEWASNLVPSCQSCNSWKGARRMRVSGA